MRNTLAIIAVLIATPAVAESLLVEFHHEGNTFIAPGQRVPFAFHAVYDSFTFHLEAQMGGLYRPADVGQTFSVDPSEIADFQWLLTEPSAELTIRSAQGPAYGHSFYTSDFWTETHFSFDANYHVPQLGIGLQGYRITNITQTIDALTENGSPPTVVALGEQTIRFYGEALPPPPVYPPLTGDYNQNGTVDTADYVVWRNLMSMPVGSRPDLPNALNGPRPPDDGDHFVWRWFYGESVPPISGAAAVPEPASWLLACLALCWFRRRRR